MTLALLEKAQKDTLKNVAIFVFDGVEVLDFAGPSEVFASAGGFRVFTVAANKNPIVCQGFIKIQPEYDLDDCPQSDIIIIPGGNMSAPLGNPKVIQWVKTNEPHAEVILSVCTGAFVLEKAGLLEGKKATTFHNAIEELRKTATNTEVLDHVRWVDNGKIVTTAGVSAGIDGSLRVVERLMGREKAHSTVRYMEYDKWNPDEGLIVTPKDIEIKQ
ncbi:MAG: DJ-1/PfpI family protein [Saprospiraceae bacterium]|nr:DJ-1/PfpI family protein [Lewinellaceae bacterium]MBP6810729.1 DJ-1/PfpI family protein [Saprospiraceae bacterium]